MLFFLSFTCHKDCIYPLSADFVFSIVSKTGLSVFWIEIEKDPNRGYCKLWDNLFLRNVPFLTSFFPKLKLQKYPSRQQYDPR